MGENKDNDTNDYKEKLEESYDDDDEYDDEDDDDEYDDDDDYNYSPGRHFADAFI